MSNSDNLPQRSENPIQISNIKGTIALAFERTGKTPKHKDTINQMVEDVLQDFGDMREDDLILAIRRGALGYYGETYSLTTQEIFKWIRSRKAEIKSENLTLAEKLAGKQ